MGLNFERHSRRVTSTKRWARVRFLAKRRDGFMCVECGAAGRLEVDHILPVRTHPEKAFELANLQTMCTPCHTAKTRVECGHGPKNPARDAWRRAVQELSGNLPTERNI